LDSSRRALSHIKRWVFFFCSSVHAGWVDPPIRRRRRRSCLTSGIERDRARSSEIASDRIGSHGRALDRWIVLDSTHYPRDIYSSPDHSPEVGRNANFKL
jgi:hypothetical protein